MRRIVLVVGLVVVTSSSACGSSGDDESSGRTIDARVVQAVETGLASGVEQQLATMLRDRGVRMQAFRCRPGETEVLCELDATDSTGKRGRVGVTVVIDDRGAAQGSFTSASDPRWVRALQAATAPAPAR